MEWCDLASCGSDAVRFLSDAKQARPVIDIRRYVVTLCTGNRGLAAGAMWASGLGMVSNGTTQPGGFA